MSAAKSRCICRQQVCLEAGDNEETISLPSDTDARTAWLVLLGIDGGENSSYDNNKLDGKVSLCHFPAGSLMLSPETHEHRPSGGCPPQVTLKQGAEPSQTEEDIRESLAGASGRAMRWEAAALQMETEISALKNEKEVLHAGGTPFAGTRRVRPEEGW